MLREVRRLELRELAAEDGAGGEGAKVMLAESNTAAVHLVEELLQLDGIEHAAAAERIDDDLAERAGELHEKSSRQ